MATRSTHRILLLLLGCSSCGTNVPEQVPPAGGGERSDGVPAAERPAATAPETLIAGDADARATGSVPTAGDGLDVTASRLDGRAKNVVFIAVDDLSTNLKIYGDRVVRTPNIDRLAARGVVFDRAYTQFPWCNPSRASFLSGLRPSAVGVLDLGTPPRQRVGTSIRFLPEHFRANGYHTARVGKIYHEVPNANGPQDDPASWDVSEAGAPTASARLPPPSMKREIFDRGSPSGLSWTSYDVPDDSLFLDNHIAERAAELIAQDANGGRKFFVAVGLHAPHLDWALPKRYFDMYPPGSVSLPREPPLNEQQIPAPAFMFYDAARTPLAPSDREQAVRAYYAAISFMDAQLGVILDTLDRLDAWRNTVVVFFSDHGFQLGEHGGMWEKTRLMEEAIHAPMVMATPGGVGGSHCARTVELLDLYPTLVAAAGLPRPAHLQGKSLMRYVANPGAPAQKAAYSVVTRPEQARSGIVAGESVRTETHHYVAWRNGGGTQLYDLRTDPRELHNLAGNPAHAGVESTMQALLQQGR